MTELQKNARVFPVLALIAFIAGVAFTVFIGRESAAFLFAASAVMFAASWYFARASRDASTEQDDRSTSA